MKRKTALLCVSLAAALLLCGCSAAPRNSGTGQPSAETVETEDSVVETEENYDTGDAALDNPRNQDGIGARELLVVSFGTSYNDSRRLSIGGIEDALEAAFPDWSVRRGFTSQIVLDHVKKRDGVSMDNVGAALDRAAANGVKELAVQPTHLMNGFEYSDLAAEVQSYADKFASVSIGAPLLTGDEDFSRVADAVRSALDQYDDGETALCLMGHGTEAASNAVYGRMQEVFTEKGMDHYYIGTVEAEPSLKDLLAAVKAGGYTKVVLMPLMIVAGDHANNDMAGDEPDSWKSVFAAEGYAVTCVLHGLGELPEIQQIFVDHAQAAMDELESGGTAAASQDEAASGSTETAETVETAEAGETAALTPVYADSLREGTWPVKVESSSSMFRVVDCSLTVSGGAMTAAMTMGGTGYLYVCPGTGEEAAAADPSAWIPFAENVDGAHTFTIPVPALNADVPCAAYSRNREAWYDRTLCFRADSLPMEAWADGAYSVEVTLSSGTGRASIASPAVLTVQDGTATAEIVWSSPNYDYMLVDGVRYEPVNTEGNSVFQIPVPAFDCPVDVTADTTAMSQPHEIEYTLLFRASTIREADT